MPTTNCWKESPAVKAAWVLNHAPPLPFAAFFDVGRFERLNLRRL
jgi:hypothetical protein